MTHAATSVTRRTTLRDVARAAHVSVPVAAVVLNGGPGNNSRASQQTARRIVTAAQRLNYQANPAARQLRGVRSYTFGLLVTSAGDPQRGMLVQQLDIEAVKRGYHTLIGNTIGGVHDQPDQFDYYVGELYRRRVDGVFCVVNPASPGDRAALVARHPHTVFYEDPGVRGAAFVAPDRRMAARLAVEHLAQRGRRRVGLAMIDLDWDFYRPRVEGHIEALRQLGMPDEDEGLVYVAAWREVCPDLADGVVESFDYLDMLAERVVADLVVARRADAIVTHDDYLAAALLRCLDRHGRSVPGDVAVMGCGDGMFAQWTTPPLSTINFRYADAATAMVHMLDRMIGGRKLAPDQRVAHIAPQLVARQST